MAWFCSFGNESDRRAIGRAYGSEIALHADFAYYSKAARADANNSLFIRIYAMPHTPFSLRQRGT
jgi:hypothetical protein